MFFNLDNFLCKIPMLRWVRSCCCGSTAKVGVEGHRTDSEEAPKTWLQRCRKCVLVENLIPILLVFSLLLGTGLGFLLRLRSRLYSSRELLYLRFPGELLMNMFNLLVLPLVVSGIISGVTSLSRWALFKMGLLAGVFYLTSFVLASALGVTAGSVAGRSSIRNVSFTETEVHQSTLSEAVVDFIRQILPKNIVETTFRKTITILKDETEKNESSIPSYLDKATNITVMVTEKPEQTLLLTKRTGVNMLGVIAASIVGGIVISYLDTNAIVLKRFFNAAYDVTEVFVKIVIWYSPFGIVFLLMEVIASVEDFEETFRHTKYMAVVLTGLLVHGFVVLPIIYLCVCRQNPYAFMKGVSQALVTALATSSSAATLPVTMKNLLEKNSLDSRVVNIVAPIGATLNGHSKTLFAPVTAIVPACTDLSAHTLVIIFVTSIVAAFASATVTEDDLVATTFVLSVAGLPTSRVGVAVPLDWLLDRVRAAINVLGDAYVAGIVHNLSLKSLKQDEENDSVRSSSPQTSEESSNPQGKSSAVLVTASQQPPPPRPPPEDSPKASAPTDIIVSKQANDLLQQSHDESGTPTTDRLKSGSEDSPTSSSKNVVDSVPMKKMLP